MKDFMMVIFAIATIVLGIENYDLRRVIDNIEGGYVQILSRKVNGKPVGDYIKPGSMGIFAMKHKTIVCGELEVTLPAQEP